VYARLGLQVTIGVFTRHVESNTLDPCFFARLEIENLFAETAPVAPAQIHTQQNFRPILRLGAACARMEGDDGVAPVVRTAEKLRQLGFGHLSGDGSDFTRGFTERVVALLVFGDAEKKSRFFQICVMFSPAVNDAFQAGLFF
jgi:hypothetical protein